MLLISASARLRFCALATAFQLLMQMPQPIQGGFITNHFFSSCISDGLFVPNLSYGKSTTTGTIDYTCSPDLSPSTVPWSQIITWYYYPTYPPICGLHPLDQCCHSTINSTITFTLTEYVDSDLGTEITSTGTVTAGAFYGMTAIATGVKLSANPTQCSSTIGVEARSGNRVLTIVGGPVCTGVVTEELCHGIH